MKEVRSYLLGWETLGNRADFRNLVEALYAAGLSGPGLVYLHTQTAARMALTSSFPPNDDFN